MRRSINGKRWVGMGWDGIHRGVMSFFCFICGLSGMAQSIMIWGLSFLLMMITFSGYGTGTTSGFLLRMS